MTSLQPQMNIYSCSCSVSEKFNETVQAWKNLTTKSYQHHRWAAVSLARWGSIISGHSAAASGRYSRFLTTLSTDLPFNCQWIRPVGRYRRSQKVPPVQCINKHLGQSYGRFKRILGNCAVWDTSVWVFNGAFVLKVRVSVWYCTDKILQSPLSEVGCWCDHH